MHTPIGATICKCQWGKQEVGVLFWARGWETIVAVAEWRSDLVLALRAKTSTTMSLLRPTTGILTTRQSAVRKVTSLSLMYIKTDCRHGRPSASYHAALAG